MTIDEKKKKLRKYLITVSRLKTKCDDAARWENLSYGRSGMIISNKSNHHTDTVKDTAIQLRQECENLAVKARELRQEMNTAFAEVDDDRLRILLECKYFDGMSDKELSQKNNYSERHMRRLVTQAINKLDKCSRFFSKSCP